MVAMVLWICLVPQWIHPVGEREDIQILGTPGPVPRQLWYRSSIHSFQNSITRYNADIQIIQLVSLQV